MIGILSVGFAVAGATLNELMGGFNPYAYLLIGVSLGLALCHYFSLGRR